MFTPPPSPLPRKNDVNPMETLSLAEKPASEDPKRLSARRTKWTVLLVPLVLILVTLSTHTLTNRVHALSVPSEPRPSDLDSLLSQLAVWSGPQDPIHDLDSTPNPPPTPVRRATAPQSLPTIPSAPPVLPTPFPQPFESLGQNFSTPACYNFIVNTTSYLPFRSCRPFSLLLQSSASFIQLQDNYTDLNTVMWGTCNTATDSDQCVSNMNWFASTLKTSCAKDLSDRNSLVVNTLRALQAYDVMRQTGCSSDPTTNTYCYLKAAFNSNPSDLYFYQLPLGNSLPKDTAPTCSACTRSLMAIYAVALKDKTQTLPGLEATYPAAAALARKECGSEYAPQLEASNSNHGARVHVQTASIVAFVLAAFAWSVVL